jgi:dGTPase
MRAHGLFFDHNLHALRIVEDFELRYIAFRGLNLTFEVREGIIKHSHDYDAERYPQLREYLLDRRPPLEAQLIDLTDEIAYNTADLDDGYEARILTVKQIRAGVRIFERFYSTIEAQHPEAPEKLKFNEAIKRMLDRMVTDLIDNTSSRLTQSGAETLTDVRSLSERLVAFSDEVEAERREAKEFLYENLYFSPKLMPEKQRAEVVVGELFDYWIAHPEALPPSYRQKAESEPLPRIICDYIAGMTDHFVLDCHRKLCGGARVASGR